MVRRQSGQVSDARSWQGNRIALQARAVL